MNFPAVQRSSLAGHPSCWSSQLHPWGRPAAAGRSLVGCSWFAQEKGQLFFSLLSFYQFPPLPFPFAVCALSATLLPQLILPCCVLFPYRCELSLCGATTLRRRSPRKVPFCAVQANTNLMHLSVLVPAAGRRAARGTLLLLRRCTTEQYGRAHEC